LALIVSAFGATVSRQYVDNDVYRRRRDQDRVHKKMIEYWSRPDVLPKLPQPMKTKVEDYIKMFPEYHYKKGVSTTSSGSKKKEPCIIQ